jgi:hypothetical protein
VDLHIHNVTCTTINFLFISRLDTTFVSPITRNARIFVLVPSSVLFFHKRAFA